MEVETLNAHLPSLFHWTVFRTASQQINKSINSRIIVDLRRIDTIFLFNQHPSMYPRYISYCWLIIPPGKPSVLAAPMKRVLYPARHRNRLLTTFLLYKNWFVYRRFITYIVLDDSIMVISIRLSTTGCSIIIVHYRWCNMRFTINLLFWLLVRSLVELSYRQRRFPRILPTYTVSPVHE